MEVVSDSKVSIRDIFASEAWSDFYEKNKDRIRIAVTDNVEKILACWSWELWYWVLKCKCGHEQKVPFTCKSRFCWKCWKKACDNWMRKVIWWALPNIKYRHVVFTIPEELRDFLLCNRKEWLDILFKTSTNALLYVFEKRYNCIPWIITVIHTFGGDIKWNPHVHVIVTHWWPSFDHKKWNYHHTIPHALLKESWKYCLVKWLREMVKKTVVVWSNEYRKFNEFLDFLYQKKLYVNIWETLESLEFTIQYIWRYAKRPVLAETRLESFDWTNVSFSFKDKLTKKKEIIVMSVEDFIWKLVRHIPDKYYRMIRYSWIFANRIKTKMLLIVQNLLSQWEQRLVYLTKPPLSWREMKKKISWIDPYQCKCGKIMELVELVIMLKSWWYKIVTLKELDYSP